jgi:hypothetical protein
MSCSKNDISNDASYQLDFSVDTLRFDTVFTELGSATKRLMVYNPNKKKVRSQIILSGKETPFRFNIDGRPVENTCNVEIAAEDSMYIFVEATIHPLNDEWPVLVTDSVIFETNGNRQKVLTEAYGQDVFILRDDTIQSQVWQGNKPYLIYGRLVVDSLHTLKIGPGVKVHMYQGADLLVKGSLVAEGTTEEPVIFSGSRTEVLYDDIPGQWGSIIFSTTSRDNILRNVYIRNGTNGILLSTSSYDAVPYLLLDAVVIRDMSYSCLMTFSSDLDAYNCLIANCGYYTTGLFGGGTSRFTHCTMVNNYSAYTRRKSIPVLSISHAYPPEGTENKTGIPLAVTVNNSIIYGTLNNELLPGNDVDYKFHHCLLRTTINSPFFENVLTQANPLFIDPIGGNFRLEETSPARNAGDIIISESIPLDLDGNNRILDGKPDLGAYEWKSE